MKPDTLKIVSIILMSLLTINSIWNLLNFLQTKFSMSSPLIPDYVVMQIAQPYLVNAIVTTSAVVLNVLLHFRSRYKISIGICVAALSIEAFLIWF